MQIEQYRRFYELEDKHWWFVGMRDIFCRLISNIYKGNKKLLVLDVGCGAGMIMKDLEKFGKVVGVDVEDAALKFCQKRDVGDLCLGSGVNLPFKDATFDLVTAFSVVEHVQDDISFIGELNRVCKIGGRIILSTSAFNFLWSQHDLINGHKKRYEKNSLKEIFLKHRLVIEKITYTNFILFPVILLAIILNNLLKRSCKGTVDVFYTMPKLLNGFLTFILKTESIILTKFNFSFGVSLLCVGRKI
ncbi:MAG: class I SAM-dependent methyltransferase [Candidatus Omnitrophica bacterium]|nr:class I SAM-dependent methyltransferase [Candidatus Omnitrophota bacterium]